MVNTAKTNILIEYVVGRTRKGVTGLGRLRSMKSVKMVTGHYDVIDIVEFATLNEVGDLVTRYIHPITGITRTVTCLVV